MHSNIPKGGTLQTHNHLPGPHLHHPLHNPLRVPQVGPDLLKLGLELLPLRLLVLQDDFCMLQLHFQLYGNTTNILWEPGEGPSRAQGSWTG